MWRSEKIWGHPSLSAEVKWRNALPSCFRFHTVNKYAIFSEFNVTVFVFLCFLLVILLFTRGPPHPNIELESCLGLLRAGRLRYAFGENTCVRWALFRCELQLLAMSSMLMNQWNVLSKVSLNRNTRKTMFILMSRYTCSDWRRVETQFYFFWEPGFSLLNQNLTLWNVKYHKW